MTTNILESIPFYKKVKRKNTMKLTESQEQKIIKVGKKYNLKLIILHGSYATNKANPESDLDIGILGKKLLDFKTISSIYSCLSEIFGDYKNAELDMKSLHKIDPLFRYQVAKYSQLLYGNTVDFNEFRAYAFQQYHDCADLFELEKKLVIKYQNHLNKKYNKNYA